MSLRQCEKTQTNQLSNVKKNSCFEDGEEDLN